MSKFRKANPLLAKPAANTLGQHLQSRLNARRKVERSITSVIERDEYGNETLLPTSVVLDPLSQAGFSALRIAEAKKAAVGSNSYFCPQCGQPLKIHAHHNYPGCADAAFFVHVPSDVACPLRDQGTSHANWAKYGGVQEGERHAHLKLILAKCLEAAPDFSHVEVEQLAVPGDRRSTRPDVSAVHSAARLALDVQLRTAYQHVIGRRESYYQEKGFHHVWLTDAEALGALDQQGFQDLYFNAGGRILAIDGQCLRDSERAGALRLVELSLLPKLTTSRRIANIWQRSMVSADVVLLTREERARGGVERYANSLQAQVGAKCGEELTAIRSAVASGEEQHGYLRELSVVAHSVGGSGVHWMLRNGVWQVLSWLHKVLEYDEGAAEEIQEVTDILLASALAKNWSHLVNNVLVHLPNVARVLSGETRSRLYWLRQKDARDLQHFHKATIAAVLPRLAFALLSTPPRLAPTVYQLPKLDG
ncbi:MAG: hypothetical protein P0Y65_14755 [Candidatus Devosia phytovorans]|uniref:Competence protein CoiA nuclease-like domain-containing protein n=1 Tax=Candidatus Devosia phytovorans TaxID=3121372 RepID=A0AAJ5VSG3_9HYPH|nr:hypothetical protein [Devosia sp.]WEK03447.1 MAG: hypothetical protein P0Y65_14755 [Devosia sp.]